MVGCKCMRRPHHLSVPLEWGPHTAADPTPSALPAGKPGGTALHHSCFSTVTHCSAPHLAAGSPGVKTGLSTSCALRVPARPRGDQVDRSESWVPDLCLARGLLGTWT